MLPTGGMQPRNSHEVLELYRERTHTQKRQKSDEAARCALDTTT